MLIIPAISPNFEQTGISSSKHFPCKALFTLETNVNTIRFHCQQYGKVWSQGQWEPFIHLVSGATVNTFLSSLKAGGHFRVVPKMTESGADIRFQVWLWLELCGMGGYLNLCREGSNMSICWGLATSTSSQMGHHLSLGHQWKRNRDFGWGSFLHIHQQMFPKYLVLATVADAGGAAAKQTFRISCLRGCHIPVRV